MIDSDECMSDKMVSVSAASVRMLKVLCGQQIGANYCMSGSIKLI